jgi:hypothetical protein
MQFHAKETKKKWIFTKSGPHISAKFYTDNFQVTICVAWLSYIYVCKLSTSWPYFIPDFREGDVIRRNQCKELRSCNSTACVYIVGFLSVTDWMCNCSNMHQ